MTNMIEETAGVNAEFVLAITSRATEILREPQEQGKELIDILLMARDEFLNQSQSEMRRGMG